MVRVYWTQPRPADDVRDLLDSRDQTALGAIEHEPGRDQSATGRALLHALLPGRTISRDCPDCARQHGKPHVDGAHVSVAHCAGLVVVAITTSGPIGVDVEPRNAADFDDLIGTQEGNRTQQWVRIEAQLKLTGTGLREDPRSANAPYTQQIDVGAGFEAALATTVECDVEVLSADEVLTAWAASSRTTTG